MSPAPVSPMLLTSLLLTSLMVTTTLASCDCGGDMTCYRDQCRTAQEISVLAFEAGKPCESHGDCKEACMQTKKCGPYLRSLRIPPLKHEDECVSDSDCKNKDESCIATLRGMECATWKSIMTEVFKLGTPCQSKSQCPEACYTSHENPTCGPFL